MQNLVLRCGVLLLEGEEWGCNAYYKVSWKARRGVPLWQKIVPQWMNP